MYVRVHFFTHRVLRLPGDQHHFPSIPNVADLLCATHMCYWVKFSELTHCGSLGPLGARWWESACLFEMWQHPQHLIDSEWKFSDPTASVMAVHGLSSRVGTGALLQREAQGFWFHRPRGTVDMEKVSAGSVSNTVKLSALQPFFSVLLHIPVSREGHWPGSDPLAFLTLRGVSANKYCFVLLYIFKHCLVLISINRFVTSSLVNFESSPLYLDLYNIPKGAQNNKHPARLSGPKYK